VVVAARESFVGLVEAGVGLLQSGGGHLETVDCVVGASRKLEVQETLYTKIQPNIGFFLISINSIWRCLFGYFYDFNNIFFNSVFVMHPSFLICH
ncbi:hypothetical protein SD73_00100, partial [Staphylococcus aureus]